MAKINIYIPDELKARMDRAGERNWSAAAQRAFELECHLVEVLMDTDDSVVARLRASKAKEGEREQADGREAGQEWARTAAEWRELGRVATYVHWGVTQEEDYPTTLVQLIMGVGDRREIDAGDERDLWRQLHDREEEPDPAWVEGFVEGAAEVWNEVADKV
jgi:hypothetical protein